MAKYRVYYIAGEVHSEDVEAKSSTEAKSLVVDSLIDEMRGVDRTEYTFAVLDWDILEEDFEA